jgi:hypothetical protein
MWVTKDATDSASPQVFDLTQDQPSRPDGARILHPDVGYRHQLSAEIYTAIFSKANTDMTLIDKMRIWVKGQVGEVDIPESDQVRFYGPQSGYTYVARHFGTENIDGRDVETGIAARMIGRANQLLLQTYVVKLDDANNPVLDAFGAPTLVLDDQGHPQLVDPDISKTAYTELVDYVGLLDAAREVQYLAGLGPLPSGQLSGE